MRKKKYKHTRLGWIWKGWKKWKHQKYIGFAFYPKKEDKKDMVRVRLTIEEII